jgi:hypothetical protein
MQGEKGGPLITCTEPTRIRRASWFISKIEPPKNLEGGPHRSLIVVCISLTVSCAPSPATVS